MDSNQAISALQSQYSWQPFRPWDSWKAWCSLFTFRSRHVQARRTWVAFFPLYTIPTFFFFFHIESYTIISILEINPKVSHSPFIINIRKISSYAFLGRMYAHQMVLAPQVDLVVQEVQLRLFLENLVNQSDQEVLAVPPHLL